MRAISLFSGAGGFEIGFERAGIQTVLQAEIDPWCLEVLARHWPEVERVHDVRQVDASTLQGRRGDMVSVGVGSDAERVRVTRGGRVNAAGIDLVYGGWPCQDVSVAGKRAGLSGERSGLFYEFARIVRDVRPRWVAAENVPGLLSSPTKRPGSDFGSVLRTLVDAGYGVAWRILDGRWFGVPQRRRRPIIVGCLGDARRAAQVLAVCESCGGHPAPRREAGQGVAYSLSASVGRFEQGNRIGKAWNTTFVAGSEVSPDSMRPLTERSTGYRMDGESENFVVAAGREAGGHPGSNLPGRHREDDENLVVAGAQSASDGHHGHSSPRGDGNDNLIAQTLNSSYAKATASGGSHGTQAPVNVLTTSTGVRRLTPLECERLMGWPDFWTAYTSDGREIPDSHRYRLCGNGVVAPVAEWIGHRLVAVDRMLP